MQRAAWTYKCASLYRGFWDISYSSTSSSTTGTAGTIDPAAFDFAAVVTVPFLVGSELTGGVADIRILVGVAGIPVFSPKQRLQTRDPPSSSMYGT